jgi:triacylglycerol lipase
MSNQVVRSSIDSKASDKGKGKAETGSLSPYHEPGTSDEPLSNALEEALTTPLSPVSVASSLESSFDRASPIPAPPQAHYSAPIRPKPPRLLSQLTRSTLPSSTSQYASGDRRVTHAGYPSQGESSSSNSRAWRTFPTTALCDEPFPDLDPSTGLPAARKASTDSNAPSLHLQRTITDLLQTPTKEPTSYLPFNFAMPRVQLPGLPSLNGGQAASTRSVSSSAPAQKDWSSWATSWWSGSKSNMDSQLAEEDQADTVEEEAEKHRRKCECCHPSAYQAELTSRPYSKESNCLLSWSPGFRLFGSLELASVSVMLLHMRFCSSDSAYK